MASSVLQLLGYSDATNASVIWIMTTWKPVAFCYLSAKIVASPKSLSLHAQNQEEIYKKKPQPISGWGFLGEDLIYDKSCDILYSNISMSKELEAR